jgi:putative addiction module component (TIGR02574 family)
MTSATQILLDTAAQLPPSERAQLVEGILTSFDTPERRANDSAWAKEAEERIAAFDRGEIAATPAAMVFEKIEKKYAK